MRFFLRMPPPDFWADRVCRWVDHLLNGEDPEANKLHGWRVDGKTLAQHFHERVRPEGEGPFCAYCDGLLGAQSPATIDHWVPRDVCQALALWWHNLFPACAGCQTAKGSQWSLDWIRPDDLDDIESLFECLENGKLVAAPEVTDSVLKERIEKTLSDLGLNRDGLCRERRWLLRDLSRMAPEDLALYSKERQYRFLASRLLLEQTPQAAQR